MNEHKTRRPSKITKEKLMATISSQLTKFMKRHGISTQANLSETSGVPKGTLSKAIKNSEKNTPLSIQNAFKIATAYGITLDYIYGNNDMESYLESVISALEKQLFPSIHTETLHGNMYLIPTITLSPCYAAYFKAVLAAYSPSLSTQTHQLCLQQAKDDLCKAMKSGTEGKRAEYALIPLKYLNGEILLNDLGINPESRRE